MAYFRRRYRRFYRPRTRVVFARPRRYISYGRPAQRRRFTKCRLNGGTWRNCKKRAFFKKWKWQKNDDGTYEKVPKDGYEAVTNTVNRTYFRKVGTRQRNEDVPMEPILKRPRTDLVSTPGSSIL